MTTLELTSLGCVDLEDRAQRTEMGEDAQMLVLAMRRRVSKMVLPFIWLWVFFAMISPFFYFISSMAMH